MRICMCMCCYIYMHLNTHIIHIYMSIFISTFIYKTQSRTYSFIKRYRPRVYFWLYIH